MNIFGTVVSMQRMRRLKSELFERLSRVIVLNRRWLEKKRPETQAGCGEDDGYMEQFKKAVKLVDGLSLIVIPQLEERPDSRD